MRTPEEILERLKSKEGSFLDFGTDVLIAALPFESARPFLKEGVDDGDWPVSTDASIKAEALDYLEFAWGKALDHRGLSAGRSIDKLTEWVWLLGDEALFAEVEAAGYAQYGAPKLAVLSKAWGHSIPHGEEVVRMAAGQPCSPDCEGGCGR